MPGCTFLHFTAKKLMFDYFQQYPTNENVKLVEASKKCEQRILALLKHFIDFPLTLRGFKYSYTLHKFSANAP